MIIAASEYLPVPHLMQVLDAEAPTVVEYVPTPQAVQTLASLAPVVAEYLPAPQVMQVEAPTSGKFGKYLPASQLIQAEAPTFECLPAPQLMAWAEPTCEAATRTARPTTALAPPQSTPPRGVGRLSRPLPRPPFPPSAIRRVPLGHCRCSPLFISLLPTALQSLFLSKIRMLPAHVAQGTTVAVVARARRMPQSPPLRNTCTSIPAESF